MAAKLSPLVAVVALAAALPLGCARESADDAFKKTRAAMEEVAGPAEKVAALQRFLERYPESERTVQAVEIAAYYLAEELDRPGEAAELAAQAQARVKDGKMRADLAFVRVEALGHSGDRAAVEQAAADLEREQASYAQALAVTGAATAVKAWELAAPWSERAIERASPEAYREDSPKADDERVARMSRRRQAESLGLRGWVLANLGQPDEAYALYDLAAAADQPMYAGGWEAAHPVHRGRTLLAEGRAEEAIEVLTPQALFGASREANEALREAWAVARGEQDLVAYLAAQRRSRARTIEDFTLPDYEGVEHAFSSLRNGEVALLAFWFPT